MGREFQRTNGVRERCPGQAQVPEESWRPVGPKRTTYTHSALGSLWGTLRQAVSRRGTCSASTGAGNWLPARVLSD